MTRIIVSLVLILFAQGALAERAEISWSKLRCLYRTGDEGILVLEDPCQTRPSEAPLENMTGRGADRSGSIPTSHTCLRLCGTNVQCILECMRDKGDG